MLLYLIQHSGLVLGYLIESQKQTKLLLLDDGVIKMTLLTRFVDCFINDHNQNINVSEGDHIEHK